MKSSDKPTDLDFDDEGADDVEVRLTLNSVCHHITPKGYARFKDELDALVHHERPKVVDVVSWAAGNGDRSENGDYIYGKKRLREIDRRVRFLSKRLKHAIIVDPKQQPREDQVFFGATVTYINDDDAEHTVTLVGVDEADLNLGCVSMASPIARALLKSRVGDVVDLHTPSGVVSLEISAIRY